MSHNAAAATDSAPQPAVFEAYLHGLQDRLCAAVEAVDGEAKFLRDIWQKPADAKLQGHGITCVLSEGKVFERAGVALSVVNGPALPPSATKARPELAGQPFKAMGLSLVFHPRNPYVPTTHCNVRLLSVGDAAWWFGGGFDLTPYYGFADDARHWHQTAHDAIGATLYPRFKRQCDEYFYLPHRQEPRGIGGLFYDDFTEGGWDAALALTQKVGDGLWQAYAPIVERRREMAYTERERQWQLLRRGRYVEFNLVWDRGTHFGLQSGGRTESILMSMPPLARWDYDVVPEAGSAEAALLSDYLITKDWL